MSWKKATFGAKWSNTKVEFRGAVTFSSQEVKVRENSGFITRREKEKLFSLLPFEYRWVSTSNVGIIHQPKVADSQIRILNF